MNPKFLSLLKPPLASLVAFLLVLTMVSDTPAAPAYVIEVTTTDQEVGSDADCSLQEAIFAANFDTNQAIDPANPGGAHIFTGCPAAIGTDTISLAGGAVYQVDSIIVDPASPIGMNANPAITSTITIQGNGATLELSDGLNLRAFVVSSGGNLTLQNLYIRGFKAKGGEGGSGGGGGGLGAGAVIYVLNGTLTVENSTFEGNAAAGGNAGAAATTHYSGGGGGGLGGNGGAYGGFAGGGGGGGGGGARGDGGNAGVYGGGGGGTVNNGGGNGGVGGYDCGGGGGGSGGGGGNGTCPGGGGGGGGYGGSGGGDFGGPGGVGAYGGGGGGGGGMDHGGAGGFGGGGGGAIDSSTGGYAGAGGFGGGGGGGDVSGVGGDFAGNGNGTTGGGGAGLGGAIFNDSGAVTVHNSTFISNTVTGGTGANPGQGLGAAIFSRNGTLELVHVTIASNTAANLGGGVYIVGDGAVADLAMHNTLLANNGVDECYVDIINSGSLSMYTSGNLIEDNAAGVNACGSVFATTDPGLAPLVMNLPGNTPTMAISIYSPAFNAAFGGECLPSDQRGVLRPQGAGCDIGAYEVAPGWIFWMPFMAKAIP